MPIDLDPDTAAELQTKLRIAVDLVSECNMKLRFKHIERDGLPIQQARAGGSDLAGKVCEIFMNLAGVVDDLEGYRDRP